MNISELNIELKDYRFHFSFEDEDDESMNDEVDLIELLEKNKFWHCGSWSFEHEGHYRLTRTEKMMQGKEKLKELGFNVDKI